MLPLHYQRRPLSVGYGTILPFIPSRLSALLYWQHLDDLTFAGLVVILTLLKHASKLGPRSGARAVSSSRLTHGQLTVLGTVLEAADEGLRSDGSSF